jgi:hypothetical protein
VGVTNTPTVAYANGSDAFGTADTLARFGAWMRSKLRVNWLLLALMAAAGAVAVAVRASVFPYYSPNNDEPVYVLQAKALLEGRLTLPLYRDLPFFQPWLTGVHGGRVIFQYTPGWPAFLALSSFLTGSMVPALAADAALVVLGMYLFAREASGRRDVGLVAAAITVATPMVILQSGLFLSYLYTLAIGLFAGYALLRGARTGRARDLAVGGALLGLILLTRPFDAVLWGIPFVVYVVVSAFGGSKRGSGAVRESFHRVGWIVVGFLPPALVMAAFNAHVSGSPTMFPIKAADPLNTFGFGVRSIMQGASTIEFTKHDALEAVGDSFRAAPVWVLGSVVGIVLALVGVYLARRRASTYVMLGLIVTFSVGYFFWWAVTVMAAAAPLGGPHYWFPMVVPVVVLGATTLVACWRWKPAVAVIVSATMIVVSAPKLLDRLDLNRALSKEPYGDIHRTLQEFDKTDALVFVPVANEPFLLNGPPFAANSPTLDGDVLFAAELTPDMIDLVASTERTPYRINTTFRQAAGDRVIGNTSIQRLHVVRSAAFTVTLQIVNPTPSAVVTAFLDTGNGLQTVVLDRDSTQGERYDLEWTVAAPLLADDGTVEMVPGLAWLRAGVRFGSEVADPSLPDGAAAQYRYVTRTDTDDITVLLPPRREQVMRNHFGRQFMSVQRLPSLLVTLSPAANCC